MSAIISNEERKEQIRWVDDSRKRCICDGVKDKMVLFGIMEGHSRQGKEYGEP